MAAHFVTNPLEILNYVIKMGECYISNTSKNIFKKNKDYTS